MYQPPKRGIPDPRLLGKGSSKMVWKLNEFAVINAYDTQRFHGFSGTQEEKIEASNMDIMMEYNFTLYLHSIFPTLIPKVYLFQNPYPFEDTRFRYVKDLCTMVKLDKNIFDKLIQISDTLLEKGWVYLDIKPENIAEQNGQLSIVDTDYGSLYIVPEEMIPDFRNWVYMIVLIFSYNHLHEVEHSTLIKFIHEKGIKNDTLIKLWEKNNWEVTRKIIAQYGNDCIRRANAGEYVQLKGNDIMNPYIFFSTYGKKDRQFHFERFYELMELAETEILEEKAEAKPQEKVEARPQEKAEAKAETKPQEKAEARPQAKAETKAETKAEARPKIVAKAAKPEIQTPRTVAKAAPKTGQKLGLQTVATPRTIAKAAPKTGKPKPVAIPKMEPKDVADYKTDDNDDDIGDIQSQAKLTISEAKHTMFDVLGGILGAATQKMKQSLGAKTKKIYVDVTRRGWSL
jgi:hypothetical protein